MSLRLPPWRSISRGSSWAKELRSGGGDSPCSSSAAPSNRSSKARADDQADLIDLQPDSARVIEPEWLIVVGLCTHLGCIPLGQKDGDPIGRYGGWFCPCHGSLYDISGRVRRGPAPKNLIVPDYVFLDESRVRIGRWPRLLIAAHRGLSTVAFRSDFDRRIVSNCNAPAACNTLKPRWSKGRSRRAGLAPTSCP